MPKLSLLRLLPSLLLSCLVTACTSSPQEQQEPEAFRVSEAGRNASTPYLTQDAQGQVVLSWVQTVDTTDRYLLTYAVSADGGRTFGSPAAIPTSAGVYPHDENLSKILFRENGDILAMYAVSNPSAQNQYAGLVFYTQSFDGARTWTEPRQLAENPVSSIDERYFDVALLPDGEVGAVWLDSRKDTDREGSSLYFARTRGRGGFGEEKVIDSPVCQCCRTDLYVDGQQRLHVAYRAILNDSIRDMMHLVSRDNGRSFSRPARISADNWAIDGCPHTGPTMASNPAGLHFAWFTMGGGSGVFYSRLPKGAGFTPREPVSEGPSAKHPQMCAFGEGRLAITWDERVPQGEQPGNRVGLQIREAEGQVRSSRFLTPATDRASYPVLLPVGPDRLLVAYTNRSEKGSEVWCQVVRGE